MKIWKTVFLGRWLANPPGMYYRAAVFLFLHFFMRGPIPWLIQRIERPGFRQWLGWGYSSLHGLGVLRHRSPRPKPNRPRRARSRPSRSRRKALPTPGPRPRNLPPRGLPRRLKKFLLPFPRLKRLLHRPNHHLLCRKNQRPPRRKKPSPHPRKRQSLTPKPPSPSRARIH